MKPAVFLDRDGVLAREYGRITLEHEFSVLPYARTCVEEIHELGYYAIVITNQSAVARGILTEDAIIRMNWRLQGETGIDGVYYCPHHPEGSVERYRQTCDCRKPNIGLIQHACKDYAIDLKKSWMIGDRESDIVAGKRAGVRTIILTGGFYHDDSPLADYSCLDLKEAVKLLAVQGR